MDPQLDEPDLRSYLGTISRRKWLVITVTALFFGVAVLMSVLAEPKYELRMQVQTRAPLTIEGGTTQALLDRTAENELAFLESSALAREVDRAYDGPLELSDISSVGAADLGRAENRVSNSVRLSFVTSDPDAGADMLRIYGETYVALVEAQEEENLQSDLGTIHAMVGAIEDEIDELRGPIDALRAEAADEPDPGQRQALLDQADSEEDIVRPELEQLGAQRAAFNGLVRESALDADLSNFGAARVHGFVSGSSTPVSPNIPQNLAIGLIFGLFLGIAAAFLRDYFDDSVNSKDAVERVTGVPAMGLIPKFASDEGELVAATGSGSPSTEAFRSLRTSVKFTTVDRDVRVIQVTSASAGEGKTVTAANLATVLAQAGDRVVLVSADLRRPRVEELFGTTLTPGLTEVLIGEVTLPQAVRAVDAVPNLSILPSGQPPTNPSELLSGERARRLVQVLAQTYDIVVLDCPPLLPVTDSLVLARMADVSLLVTSARQTSRRELERAVELLNQMHANLTGCVITSLDPDDAYSSGPYGYDTIVPASAVPANGGVPAVSGEWGASAAPGGDGWSPAPEGMPGAPTGGEYSGWPPSGSQYQ
jgi:capsular exopolysaccharide synthesis family protein